MTVVDLNATDDRTAARLEALRYLTEDVEDFAQYCLKIKPKVGPPIPFLFNDAQRHIHTKIEEQIARVGYVRKVLLKGRQQGGCLDPETPVLTADLRWVPIKSLQPGDQLVATDEEPEDRAKGKSRKMRTAVVQKVWTTRKQSYRIALDDGRSVVCSADHRWLSRKSQTQAAWRSLNSSAISKRGRLQIGDWLRTTTDHWGDASLDDAWFGGVIDGEGSLDYRSTGVSLAVSQRAGAVLSRMEAHCTARGYQHYIVSDDGPRKTKLGQDPVHAVTVSGMDRLFRLMGLARPVRFIGAHWWAGKRMPDGGWRQIASIEPVGEMELVDIETSTGTFLANGVVSHNSTYIAGRYYKKTSTQKSTSAFIVAHEQKATDNLFSMVKRFHTNNPLAPSTGATNAKELIFDLLDGGYKLATAGSDDVGRSNTAQLMHGSEFAFWRNAADHLAGIGNTIALAEGTEMVFESTANGMGNPFHEMWQNAEAGEGVYEPIFVPWFWQSEYAVPPPANFELSDDDMKYMEAFKLTPAQMYFRRLKQREYGSDKEWLFDQEYPGLPVLAFQTGTTNPLVNPMSVQAAIAMIRSFVPDRSGAYVVGVDPAEEGMDRTAIVHRKGRTVVRVEYHKKMTPMQVAGMVAHIYMEGRNGIDQKQASLGKPDAIFLDKIGLGAGILSRLQELNIPVIGVNSAMKPNNTELFENKRAEMWWTMRDWVEDSPCWLPNDMALTSDLCAPQPRLSSNGKRLLEKKEDMRKRGVRSPDGGDALALTFAEPVLPRAYTSILETGAHQPPTRAGY